MITLMIKSNMFNVILIFIFPDIDIDIYYSNNLELLYLKIMYI